MKAFLALFAAGALLTLTGCESDLPPATPAQKKLERGITGQGTLYQPERADDPFIRDEARVGQ